MSADPHKIVTKTKEATLNLARAAAEETRLKRLALCSSSTAATLPKPNTKYTITSEGWDDEAVRLAWAPPPDTGQERAFACYAAPKTQGEQALWNFVKEQNPTFVVNTVLPDTCLGPVLSRENQGDPSDGVFPPVIFAGSDEEREAMANFLPPQYMVDVQDIARLFVIGLLHPDVRWERLFGFAYPFNFNNILGVFRERFPDRKWPDDFPGLGREEGVIEPRERAAKLLTDMYGKVGFTGLEETVMENVEAFIKDPSLKPKVRMWDGSSAHAV
jgi:nucleoside-diphosphate-sugar epimerase